jgi:hypothetical protein
MSEKSIKKELKEKLNECSKDELMSFCYNNDLPITLSTSKEAIINIITSHHAFLSKLKTKKTMTNSWPFD